MAGSDASAGVAVEVLVEQQVVVPMGVGLEAFVRAEDGAASVLVAQEDVGEPTREVFRDLPEGQVRAGAGGAFDQELVAIVVVELLERPARALRHNALDLVSADAANHRGGQCDSITLRVSRLIGRSAPGRMRCATPAPTRSPEVPRASPPSRGCP